MRIGLSMYGTVFSMGLSAASGRERLRPLALMERALLAGLRGVELPAALLEGEDVEAVARYARGHDLFLTLDTGGYNPTTLAPVIDLAAQLDAPIVRIAVGGARLGGDRRALAGRWQPFLQQALAGLEQATRLAEQADVVLAVENHQDLASEELLWLCETIASPSFGLTLDTGSPLATAEVPLAFARQVAPYVKNVHLKDYRLFMSDEGYRLVRCPLGMGVVDFSALFALLGAICPEVPASIELGALEARDVRVLADHYWPDYPPRSAAQLAHVLRFVHSHAQRDGDWRTPFERDEPVEAIIAYEEQQLTESLAFLAPFLA
jgi:sugar phosphate isomerase/epimerase